MFGLVDGRGRFDHVGRGWVFWSVVTVMGAVFVYLALILVAILVLFVIRSSDVSSRPTATMLVLSFVGTVVSGSYVVWMVAVSFRSPPDLAMSADVVGGVSLPERSASFWAWTGRTIEAVIVQGADGTVRVGSSEPWGWRGECGADDVRVGLNWLGLCRFEVADVHGVVVWPRSLVPTRRMMNVARADLRRLGASAARGLLEVAEAATWQ